MGANGADDRNNNDGRKVIPSNTMSPEFGVTCSRVRVRFEDDGDKMANHGWYLSTRLRKFFRRRPQLRNLRHANNPF